MGSGSSIAAGHRKLYSIRLQGQPIQLEIMKLRNAKALLVALKQELRIYNDRMLVYKLATDDVISNIKFGPMVGKMGVSLCSSMARDSR